MQKNTSLSFVKMTADKSSNRIVNSILNDIVNKLPLSSETVPHDGSKGNRKTFDEWQIAYPWIELTVGKTAEMHSL